MSKKDEIYYKHGANTPLTQKVLRYARQQMYLHLVNTMGIDEETTILDFGVSEHITDESNFLEKNASYLSNITCAGIGDGTEVRQEFPQVNYVSLEPNVALPFSDKQFDLAYSNAVFEHLESDQMRTFFFNELSRVSKKVYICVPNRWFPVEHHTTVPFAHYCPKVFRWLLKNGERDFWSKRENLEFLGKAKLKQFSAGASTQTAYTGIWLGPFSSNIAIWSD